MPVRRDGEKTWHKILEAACVEFGEKGYHDATHAAICKRAGANIAAINYHFGSKDALYREVWNHSFALAEKLYPVDEGVTADTLPEERLRVFLRAMIYRRVDQERLDYFHSIRMREMFNPTGLLDDLIMGWIQKNQQTMQGILKEILGEKATREDVILCDLNIIAPVLLATDTKHAPHRHKTMPPPPWHFAADSPDQFLEHLLCFVMAGLTAVRGMIKERAA